MAKISTQLDQSLDKIDHQHIKIGTLLKKFGQRSIGVGLFIFALPNLIPFANIFGIAWILAPILAMFSLQLMLNLQHPYLPKKLKQTTINAKKIEATHQKIKPYLKKIERVFKSRLGFMFNPVSHVTVGLICFLLSLIMFIPLLPLGDVIPAFLICLFAISLLQQDGALLIAAFITTSGTLLALYSLWYQAFIALIS